MPAKIDLNLSLPDGDVTARRNYPLAQERRDPSDPARQADEREWVAAELPDAIRQLYARAGLALADPREDLDRIKRAVRALVDQFPESMRGYFEDAGPLQIVEDSAKELHERAKEIDRQGGLLDAVLDAIGLDTPQLRGNVADADVPAAVKRVVDSTEGNPSGQVVSSLLAVYGLPQNLDDNVFLHLMAAREKERAADRRRGQLDVLEALDVDASQLPEEADLADWGARSQRAWFEEARRPLEAELSLTQSYLAMLADKLEVGGPTQLEKLRAGELSPADLGDLVGAADDKIVELGTLLPTSARLRDAANRLLEFFELPLATPDEKLAERVIKASTEAIRDDVKDLTDRADQNMADLSIVLGQLGRIAEAYAILSPLEASALREGRVRGGVLKSVAGEVGRAMIDRYAEQGIMRSLAAEVAALAGGSGDARQAVSDGSLAPQELANRLREYKAALRKGTPGAERDVYRRLLDDIAAKLGTVEGVAVRDTLLPGAVGDLVNALEGQYEVVGTIREVLSELRGGLGCADVELPGLIRQTVLSSRYPAGAALKLRGQKSPVTVQEVSARVDETNPLDVLERSGFRRSIRLEQVEQVLALPGNHHVPSDFDATRLRLLAEEKTRQEQEEEPASAPLPEGGLDAILAKFHGARLTGAEKVDDAVVALGERMERFTDRLVGRITEVAERVHAEIGEAIENAEREKRDGK